MKGGNTLIREKIDKGEFHELLSLRQGNLVQSVDFSDSLVRDGFILGDFHININTAIPPTNNDLVLLFPNNEKNKRHQVLYTKGYSNPCRLNKRLNKFFKQSSDKTDEFADVKLAVCYGEHVIICKQITGTIYLLWAKYVVKVNQNGHATVPQQNVPLIVNFDGRASLKAVYILKKEITNDCDLDRLPVTDHSPIFTFDMRVPLFVCETRADKDIPQQNMAKLHTMSEKEAETSILAMAEGQFDNEVNVFEQSADREYQPDSGTPRSSVYRSDIYFPPSNSERSKNDPFQE
jgi:hypothetical protein